MNWLTLNDINQLDIIKINSFEKTQVIFKHSTRCSISVTAKNKMDEAQDINNVDCYYLDLLSFRNISSTITEKFDVAHESPQIIVVKNGLCTYDVSHMAINETDLLEQI